jgi:hypothetical protein
MRQEIKFDFTDEPRPATCCESYARAKKFHDAWFKVFNAVLGGNPRYWVSLADGASDEVKLIIELGARSHCPCNDVPHPDAYREWIAGCLQADVNPCSDAGVQIGERVVAKHGLGD